MNAFRDALIKAGIPSNIIASKGATTVEFTLEMKLYEMREHIMAFEKDLSKISFR